MKRKHETGNGVPEESASKALKVDASVLDSFGPNIFKQETVQKYRTSYTSSEPYASSQNVLYRILTYAKL